MPRTSRTDSAPIIGDRMPKVSALDGIRGLAIFAVFGYHLMPKIFPGGFLGVDMFFVLSAFLISSILMTEFQSSRASSPRGRIDFARFYRHRALRLAPALVVFVVLLGPLSAHLGAHSVKIGISTVYALFYVMDFASAHVLIHTRPDVTYNHLWSLAAEEQFYFIWPAVLLFFLRRLEHRQRTTALLEILGACVIAEWASGARLNDVQSYFFLSGHLAPLAIGCLAAELAVFGLPPWMHRLLGETWLAVVVFLAVLFSTIRWYGWRLAEPDAHRPYVLPMVAFALGVGWLTLHSVAQPDSPLSKVLSTAPLRWLGSRSYGFYVYHVPIWFMLKPPSTSKPIPLPLLVPLVFILSGLFAEASFRWFERPIARAGRRRWDQVRAPAEPVAVVPEPASVFIDPGFPVFGARVEPTPVAAEPVAQEPVDREVGRNPLSVPPPRMRKMSSRTSSTTIRRPTTRPSQPRFR